MRGGGGGLGRENLVCCVFSVAVLFLFCLSYRLETKF